MVMMMMGLRRAGHGFRVDRTPEVDVIEVHGIGRPANNPVRPLKSGEYKDGTEDDDESDDSYGHAHDDGDIAVGIG